jgi:tetratricopeptide (TPR) repeat protein
MSFKIFLFCFLCCLFSNGATQAMDHSLMADSLKNVLFHTDDPKEKIRIYLQLADVFKSEKSDTAILYLGSARTLAKQVDDPALLGEVYYAMGNFSVIRNNLDLAFADYKVAANLFHQAGDTLKYARMVMLQGNIMGVRDNSTSALACYMEASTLAEKYKYNAILSHLYNNMGEIYMQSDDRKKAMEYYTKALELFIRNGDSASKGIALLTIGMVYYYLGNNEMAKYYANRSLAVFVRVNDNTNMASCFLNLGMIESGEGNYINANKLLTQSIGLVEGGDQNFQGPMNVLRSEILIRMGINFMRMGDYRQSKNYLVEGYNLACSMKQPRMVILAAENLSKNYEKQEDNSEALHYYKIFMQESDSLSKVITVRSVELTEIRQEYLRKQQENDLRIQFEKSKKRTVLIIYIISGAILLTTIVILFLLLKLEKHKKIQTEIEKKALDEKLEFHNREMTTNVMYINKMNEQVLQIAEKLKSLSIDENSPNAQIIKSIIKELGQGSQTDTWKEFEVRFENIHNDFYRHLTEKYPDLTPNELKLCAFLRLNMSTKEISSLTYQSENSIMVARTRLRQKLDISRNENLVTFLSQF